MNSPVPIARGWRRRAVPAPVLVRPIGRLTDLTRGGAYQSADFRALE